MPLYHFTDPRNLPSIRRFGLLSWQQLIHRRIEHYPASNQLSRYLDVARNLQNYIRLCLRQEHPMVDYALRKGRINNIVWLTIDDVVMRWRTTLFSNRNATANGVIINHDPQTALNSGDNQAEVLVEGILALRWIKLPQEEPDIYDFPF